MFFKGQNRLWTNKLKPQTSKKKKKLLKPATMPLKNVRMKYLHQDSTDFLFLVLRPPLLFTLRSGQCSILAGFEHPMCICRLCQQEMLSSLKIRITINLSMLRLFDMHLKGALQFQQAQPLPETVGWMLIINYIIKEA